MVACDAQWHPVGRLRMMTTAILSSSEWQAQAVVLRLPALTPVTHSCRLHD